MGLCLIGVDVGFIALYESGGCFLIGGVCGALGAFEHPWFRWLSVETELAQILLGWRSGMKAGSCR